MSKNQLQLPAEFLERLAQMYGSPLINRITESFIERPTTFRVNTIKATRAEILEFLRSTNYKVEPVSWYSDAFVLKNRTKRELMEESIYLEGKIYLQSLASMVPPLVLDPKPGETVLDLTAAPGSKTSQIAALMQTQGEFVANDNNKIRFFKLKHNVDLLGVSDSPLGRGRGGLKGNDEPTPAHFAVRHPAQSGNWTFRLHLMHGAALSRKYPKYFDKILLDAPCSAEARFIEGDSSTYGYWSERKVKEMAYKQRQLLFAAWAMLKPGGTLVYSTCTFAPEENEIQIARLLERFRDTVEVIPALIPGLQKLPILKSWHEKELSAKLQNTLRILPTKDIEGFFVAKLKKVE